MIPQLFKTKLTAGVIAVTFCSAGVAAAATGGLPGPLQRGLDRAAEVVGHDVPPNHGSADADDEMEDSDDSTTTSSGSTTSTTVSTTSTDGSTTSSSSSTTEATTATSDETTSSTDGTDDMDDEDAEHDEHDEMKDTPVGPDATGPAKKGLCNAYMHSVAQGHSKNADAVAFRNLTEAAEDAGQTVEEFCGDEMPVDTGTTTASSAPMSSSSMPSDDDDDDEMTSTSAKVRGNSGTAGGNAKHGKP